MAKAQATTGGSSGSAEGKTGNNSEVQAAPPIVFTPEKPDVEWEAALHSKRLPWPIRWFGWLAVLVVGLVIVVSLVYSGKALPGVTVDGVKVSGLPRDDAIMAVTQHLAEYKSELLPINYNGGSESLSLSNLDLKYDVPASVDTALAYGRTGSLFHRARQQLRSLLGRPTNLASFQFDDEMLAPELAKIETAVNSGAVNASLNFSGDSVTVNASSPGLRLNTGYLTMLIQDRLAATSLDPIIAPIGAIQPLIDAASLQAVRDQAATWVAGPLTLITPSGTVLVAQTQIVSWVKVSRPSTKTFAETRNVADYYGGPAPITLALDEAAIKAFVVDLAAKIDQPGRNAVLTMKDGQLSIAQPSVNGQALDQTGVLADIKSSLAKPAENRQITLNVKVHPPDVNENNLSTLGINTLISEGVTYFPHSTADRITNITVGTSKFNGILIKPGDTFSFGQYLGDVDAANGYRPGLAIVGNKIEPQYGGGLCQVSSTAYRAALLAGLPITERVNHAYAVGYYTAPYGVPGVDATIYEPQVDLKFVNDTGSYILVQTILDVPSATLKFDFYGTKTKSGAIRGPFFVTGSNDETKASTTVFYRDIMDLTGKVIKTDSVTTHYASSLDFTEVKKPGLD